MTTFENQISQRREPTDDQLSDIDEAAHTWFLRLSEIADVTELNEQEQLERAKLLATFDGWRNENPRHGAAYDELTALWHDVGGLQSAFAPVESTQSSRRSAPAMNVSFISAHLSKWGSVGAICAALLVAITVDFPTLLTADHSTAVGEQVQVILPDGSDAWLNTDTAIAVNYSPSKREIILLKGEAFFDVVKNRSRPFDVRSLGGHVKAVGTAFTVREQEGRATVSVGEGIVQVTPAAQINGEEVSVLVSAGKRTHFGKNAPASQIEAFSARLDFGWQRGMISFHDLPLDEAVAEIDRYLPGKIILMGDEEKYQPITARLFLNGLDDGVEALAKTHGLTVFRITDYLTIIR